MRRLAVLGLVSLLTACAATPRSPAPASRPLVAPAALGQDREVSQVVRAAVGAREVTLNCVVTVREGTMTVVGLNAVGVRLFTVRYDGQAVQADKSPGVPSEVRPEQLLADLQLVYWPLPALQSRLQAEGWQLSEPSPGIRRLRRGGQLVAEVHYGADPAKGAGAEQAWTGRIWLVNFQYDYALQIDSQVL